jgi:hypothetical protein
MKKYITCTLLCLIILHPGNAQDSVITSLERIIKPYENFEGFFEGQNLLFENNWVKARVLTANNSIVSNDSFRFNFNKMDRALITTADYKKVFEIDWREFKAVLFYIKDSAYIFRHIEMVNNKDLFQVLVNGNDKYSLFKTTHTKLVKGHYGGLSPAPYDRFSDHFVNATEYCILFPNREYRIFYVLKRAAIERIFKLNPDGAKVKNFLDMTGNKELYEESDLLQLISYLNNESL